MSAFVVEHKTINRIVSKLGRGDEWEIKHLLAPVLKAAEVDSQSVEPLQELGIALLVANVDAVQQRYPDDLLDNLPGTIGETLLNYRYRYEMTSRIQALKSLSCLHYQMAEGDVPERAIYKALQDLQGQWAIQIVQELPEYESAVYA